VTCGSHGGGRGLGNYQDEYRYHRSEYNQRGGYEHGGYDQRNNNRSGFGGGRGNGGRNPHGNLRLWFINFIPSLSHVLMRSNTAKRKIVEVYHFLPMHLYLLALG
jgi:hypothetical protein